VPVKAMRAVARTDPADFRMNVEKSQAALDQANAALAQIGAQRELEKSKILVAEAALRSAEAQTKNADITLQRATTLTARSFASQATVDADTAAAVPMRSAVD
jgi:multidrug resistance efflux pump